MTEGEEHRLWWRRTHRWRLWRDANDGADVDDRARATLDECWCRGVRQSREGDAVECNYPSHFVDVSIEKRHDGADTSVVDEAL